MKSMGEVDLKSKYHKSSFLPAILLFFLAPFFGEYLLGNLTLLELILLPFLAPLYGGGALLIRETTRRAGLGSFTMLTLGVAYALLEEGIVDQMLFNVNYFPGQEQISGTYIASIGIDAWLTIIVLAMHAIWSTFIPIILVETLFLEQGNRPWLSRRGLSLVVAIFIIGSAHLCYIIYLEEKFFASVPQLIGTVVVILILITVAFKVGRYTKGLVAGYPPNPWIVGGFSLVFSSLFMLTDMLHGWITVVVCLLLVIVFFTLILIWSHRSGWGAVHRMAAAGGGIFTYAWLGLFMEPESGPKVFIDYIGSGIFACVAIILFIIAVRKLQLSETS